MQRTLSKIYLIYILWNTSTERNFVNQISCRNTVFSVLSHSVLCALWIFKQQLALNFYCSPTNVFVLCLSGYACDQWIGLVAMRTFHQEAVSAQILIIIGSCFLVNNNWQSFLKRRECLVVQYRKQNELYQCFIVPKPFHLSRTKEVPG